MKWLDQAVRVKKGISWGIPWDKGTLTKDEAVQLNQLGNRPAQTKVMAYWPDQSVKWTAHAAVFEENEKITNDLSRNDQEKTIPVALEKYNGVYVDNGALQAFFPKQGVLGTVIEWIKVNGKRKAESLRLFAESDSKRLLALIEKIEVEENGPVKAVIKVTAKIMKNEKCLQEVIVRFRFYQGVPHIEVVHTAIIASADSLDGIGLELRTQLEGEPWNRHVRLMGEEGIYTEPAQLLLSRRHAVANTHYERQLSGEIVEFDQEEPELLIHARENAIWNQFHLTQLRPNHYEITKKTGQDYTDLQIGCGNRSKGMVYVGGRSGGISCAIEKFWEKAPREIAVTELTGTSTKITLWLWTPKGGTIDFRHYSERDHMLSAYEGMEENRSTPIGIANTNTMVLSVFTAPPSNEELVALAEEASQPARIVSQPEDYYRTKALGVWSLPNRSTPMSSFLEEQMLFLRKFYIKEIDQRDWYGFWSYGDVMHTYDPYRHVWRYDMGGYAWQNTELVPNMWLWQDFLRTGDAEAFYLAEAMTRHTSEVDQYHLGEYKGLGSRHNVLHWGCQCKEARISMAGLHRYYYFLTADERVGDLLTEVKDNEQTIFDELAPLREFYPEKVENNYPIRVGPDWAALTSNWFTEWERTGNINYRNHIETGIHSIKNTKNRLLTGPTYLFDKETKEMHDYGTGNVGGYHMIISFGAPQVWLELAQSLGDEEWEDMLAEFGSFYALSNEEKKARTGGDLYDQHFAWPVFASGLMGYAASHYKDEELAHHAWNVLLNESISGVPLPMEASLQKVTNWKSIEELPWISTNIASQWCLNIILCLEFIQEYLPESIKQKTLEEEK